MSQVSDSAVLNCLDHGKTPSYTAKLLGCSVEHVHAVMERYGQKWTKKPNVHAGGAGMRIQFRTASAADINRLFIAWR